MWNAYNDRRYRWNELFGSEEELIEALKQIDPEEFKKLSLRHIVGGYQYIESFVRRLKSGKELTPAQLRQAKRLAKDIKIYHEYPNRG